MQQDNARNTIIFIVCAVAILVLYQVFVLQPQAERRQAEQPPVAEGSAAADASRTVGRPETAVFTDRRQALAAGPRVPIRSESLTGSINLQGARIDDLFLLNYRETLNADSPPVELFRPQGAEHAFFSYVGWTGQNIGALPGPDTVWSLTSGSELSPGQPVVLSYANDQGLTFTRTISVDERYMFTITDTVANNGARPVTLAPYGSVQRWAVPSTLGRQMIVHEGAIGVFGAGDRFNLQQSKYGDWAKEDRPETFSSTGGWLGITDKYWLAALLPEQDEPMSAEFRVRRVGDVAVHETNFVGQAWTIAPGRQATETTHLFTGAKRSEILGAYGEALNAPRLTDAIDWGMFWFLTKPLFSLIEWFYGLVGNFGVAILLLTVVVKLALFPLANKAYESMSRMKNLQPKMEEIKKKHAGDAQKQQQAMMALYQQEKINPLAGCLPLLIQIPIFYALYKTLFVTIEMRHAPFMLWIEDLSARDPTTIWNLFGLIPWDPATVPMLGGIIDGPLHLGVLPLVYGLTMWLQMAMNPPAADPMQRQIFALLPFVFTFIMAPFAAGLILYWAWSNVLTIIQQYFIMHRFKADNPIDSFIARMRKPKDA